MVPALVVDASFVLAICLGVFVVVWTLWRPPVDESGSGKLRFGKWEFQFNGRSIFQLSVGAVFTLCPALFASASAPVAIVPSPTRFQSVDTIPDPKYSAFIFLRDTSLLDLRERDKASLWAVLSFGKAKSHPVTLTNAMTIRKKAPGDVISFTYSTSGTLHARCVTHTCTLRRAIQQDAHAGGQLKETWELTADVKDVPVGGDFELVTEVTYWNAFDGADKQWYATYPNAQTETETLAIGILFPEQRPFAGYSTWAYPHGSSDGQRFVGSSRVVPGENDLSLYWEIPDAQGIRTFEIRWSYKG